MRLALLVTVLVVFTTWSLWLVHDDGIPGLFALLRDIDWGAQVFVDLGITLVVAWTFLHEDAKARGVPVLPYIVATPFVGSIAVLAFLIHREVRLRAA